MQPIISFNHNAHEFFFGKIEALAASLQVGLSLFLETGLVIDTATKYLKNIHYAM